MGLIKTNYIDKDTNIHLENAYAKLDRIYLEHGTKANSYFKISDSRENAENYAALNTIHFECEIDKKLPIYEQIYTKAKEEIFTDWKDDIVE